MRGQGILICVHDPTVVGGSQSDARVVGALLVCMTFMGALWGEVCVRGGLGGAHDRPALKVMCGWGGVSEHDPVGRHGLPSGRCAGVLD